MRATVRTKSGRVLSEAEIDNLASRAEEGLDLSKWTPRRGRPSLDLESARSREPSPRIAVRVPRALHRRVSTRAAGEGRTISEVVRDLLTGYAANGR